MAGSKELQSRERDCTGISKSSGSALNPPLEMGVMMVWHPHGESRGADCEQDEAASTQPAVQCQWGHKHTRAALDRLLLCPEREGRWPVTVPSTKLK